MKKNFLFSVLFSLLTLATYAQSSNLKLGVDYLKTGELQFAKQIFTNSVSQDPALANYYLGEVAYEENNFTVAQDFYNKSLAASAEYPLAEVGLGKCLLKSGDLKGADNDFSLALKKDKKDVTVNVAIAEAYFVNGNEDKANEYIDKAIKYDSKSPLPYILQGDILAKKGNIGDASGKYEMALGFDPNCTPAYIKFAKIYYSINSDAAIEKLKKVIAINPDYALAYRDMGTIYNLSGRYKDAIDAYQLYFKDNTNYSIMDLTRFASSYYFTKQYDQAQNLLKQGLAKEPNNFVLNRLEMYCLADTKQYTDALPVAQKLFSLPAKKEDRILQDYMTYGDVLAKNDMTDSALVQYKKAIAIDPSKVVVYKEIAKSFAGAKRYAEAGQYLKEYTMKADSTLLESTDFYYEGQYYYYAASQSLKDTANVDAKANAKTYLKEADDAFAGLIARKPDLYLGYLWRARTNALLDPDTKLGLAKPYYEQMITVIPEAEKDKYAAMLTESYRYLTFYYYLKEDKANCIEFGNKWLALDTENANAKAILADISKK